MLGLPVHDLTSGFRAYRADTLRAIDLNAVGANGYGFQIEMAYRAARIGARIQEVPIRFVDRELGESKMSAATIIEALLLVTKWGVTRGWSSVTQVARTARVPSRRRGDSQAAGRQPR